VEHAVTRNSLNTHTGPDEPPFATIMPQGFRGDLIGFPWDEEPPAGRHARNATRQPVWTEGPTGDLGVNDPECACED
jgi:hypothetical protein